jgi:hypothetical protein
VALGAGSGSPYYWRGRFRVEQGDSAGAASDFAVAVERNPTSVRELAALAETLARASGGAESVAVVARGEALDRAVFTRERASFAGAVKPHAAASEANPADPQAGSAPPPAPP